MRIGVDARELCGHPTGVGRYLLGLLVRWTDGAAAGRHEFILYAPGALAASPGPEHCETRTLPGEGGTWWEQVTLPAAASRDRLDVWFAPANTAPLRLRVPMVVTIHDVSFVAHPEWFRAREGARRRFFCRRSASKARSVITVSDFSRREIMDRLQVPPEKIGVIPPGIDARAPKASSSRPSVLFVGSIFNRRRVTDLIRAFAPIARARPDATLDIVGDNRTYPHEDLMQVISREALDAQVRWHRYVSDGGLAEFYARARAFAFLSEYEGLGLTPLEALAAGVPPVLLDTPVARETCDGAAIYVPANDLAAATRAIEMALFSEEARSPVLRAAPAVLARYDWARTATATLELLERACA